MIGRKCKRMGIDMPSKKDLTGQRFGRLVVLEEGERTKSGQVIWYCMCDCGNERRIPVSSLTSGRTKSCGCRRKDVKAQEVTTHGFSKGNPTYRSWAHMLARCHNPNNKYYHNYGGRGIKVCDRWRYSFENFLADMGERPNGKTIDRKDNDGGYEPGNCRWADWQSQMSNRRGRGYFWRENEQKWTTKITVNYKQIHLGYFDTPEEARQAYIEAKWKYHGVWLDK